MFPALWFQQDLSIAKQSQYWTVYIYADCRPTKLVIYIKHCLIYHNEMLLKGNNDYLM